MSAMVDKGPSNALAKLNSQVGSSRHAQGVSCSPPAPPSLPAGSCSSRDRPAHPRPAADTSVAPAQDLFTRPGSSSQSSGFRTARQPPTQREQKQQPEQVASQHHHQHHQQLWQLPSQPAYRLAQGQASPSAQAFSQEINPQHTNWAVDYHAQAPVAMSQPHAGQQQQHQQNAQGYAQGYAQSSALSYQGFRPMPSFAPAACT